LRIAVFWDVTTCTLTIMHNVSKQTSVSIIMTGEPDVAFTATVVLTSNLAQFISVFFPPIWTQYFRIAGI
jgi:hypothetical protein